MVNWETLKLIPTPESNNEIIICLLLINAMMFIMAWLITTFILSIATDEVKEETQSKKHKRLNIYQYTVIFMLMVFVSSGYLNKAKERYYTINVAITTEEVKAQEIYNIKEIEKFSETLIRQKNKEYRETFFNLYPEYKYKTISNYFSRYTKLKNENGQIIFTTKLDKSDYEKYETPEEFKSDIETLAKYTVEYTKDQIKKRPEIMENFTKEHLTKAQ